MLAWGGLPISYNLWQNYTSFSKSIKLQNKARSESQAVVGDQETEELFAHQGLTVSFNVDPVF
jgi:hypothetical protein